MRPDTSTTGREAVQVKTPTPMTDVVAVVARSSL
jgi:hypothetical protein